MTPTDPHPLPPKPARRPSAGGGAIYRHLSDHAGPHAGYHDGVQDHAPDDELHNSEVAHEHTDVNVRAIITSGIVLVLVTLVANLVIVFLFGWLEQEAAANQPPPSPVARPATEMPATTTASPAFNEAAAMSEPRLLTNEPMALQKHRAEQHKMLHEGGWVNEAAGVARIPIAAAKQRLVERGVAVRADGAVPADLGTRLPAAGEASGGRVITVPLPDAPPDAPAQPAAAKPHGGH